MKSLQEWQYENIKVKFWIHLKKGEEWGIMSESILQKAVISMIISLSMSNQSIQPFMNFYMTNIMDS